MHVTAGSGTAATSYEVTFNIETNPGATGTTDLCQGEVTAYPDS